MDGIGPTGPVRLQPVLSSRAANGISLITDADAAANGILVTFSDRHGGVSAPPYDSLNLAARVGDDPAAVVENRRRVGRAAGFDEGALALAKQVHGSMVLDVPAGASGVLGTADILTTRARGVVLGILTADCAPVVLAGDEAMAVVHAGWRGIAGGAIERGVAAIGRVRSAWVGPAIRSCCYEVGPDVIDAWEARGLPLADDRRVDVVDAAVTSLERAGVHHVAYWDACTSCDDRYFSYRRDGLTGRQGAFASMLE